jgi:hypothetical protein
VADFDGKIVEWNGNWPLFDVWAVRESRICQKGPTFKAWRMNLLLRLVVVAVERHIIDPNFLLNGKFIFLPPVLINKSPAAAWKAEKTHGPAAPKTFIPATTTSWLIRCNLVTDRAAGQGVEMWWFWFVFTNENLNVLTTPSVARKGPSLSPTDG